MSKHTNTTLLKKSGTILMALGAMAMVAGSQGRIAANLTEQGSYIGTIEGAKELSWSQPEVVLAAAPDTTNALGVLAFGMLMMLIGFGIHAWIVVHKHSDEQEQEVPVRAARKSRRQAEVIWVERTIRL